VAQRRGNPFHTEVATGSTTPPPVRSCALRRPARDHHAGRWDGSGRRHRVRPPRRQGEANYTIGENLYLAKEASTLSYDATITIGDDTWSYDETTMLRWPSSPSLLHTDRNTLHRVG